MKNRRSFIKKTTLGLGAAALTLSPEAWAYSKFNLQDDAKKLGIAIVGLGYYGNILAEALQETKSIYLAGIVTGSPDKATAWQEKYGIKKKNTYSYDNFDEIAKNKEIDVVYVVLPNSMHKEYTIRAAQAGKHVICEKPMALDPTECREMIAACEKDKVKLSIGYRMQFEPTTQEIMRLGQEEIFGKVKYVSASAGYYAKNPNPDHWKAQKKMGGGAMMDMGVYSLQGARYSIGEEPTSVTAQTFKRRPQFYKDVDETTTFQLEFPGGAVANLHTTFYNNMNYLDVRAENGWFRLDPFSSYSGIKGMTSEGVLDYPIINQQAAQMDDVAQSIINNKPMRVPGEEGLKDMIVVEAIYKSIANDGKKIMLT